LCAPGPSLLFLRSLPHLTLAHTPHTRVPGTHTLAFLCFSLFSRLALAILK
jgi:hypothetical protein